MGSYAILWASKKQPIVAQCIVEAKYIAVNAATCQAIWLRRILIDLNERKEDGTIIYCDNILNYVVQEFNLPCEKQAYRD